MADTISAAEAASLQTHHEVSQFLFKQSNLLDGKQWQAWIDLFTEDGLYWMPPGPEYTTWDGQPAIFIEDRDLMSVRMKRVTHPNAWSQQAEWGTSHVVSNVMIDGVDAATGELLVRSRFHMLEIRRDDVRNFAGTYQHRLRRVNGQWKIAHQRVDLTNGQAAYEYVLQIWV